MSSLPRRLLSVGLAVALGSTADGVFAAPDARQVAPTSEHATGTGDPASLSAAEAVQRALQRSPELLPPKQLLQDTSALGSVAAQAALLRPTLSAEGGIRRSAAGERHPELSLSLVQPIPLSSIGAARERHAQALVHSARSELDRDSLELVAEVLGAWLELSYWELVEQHWVRAVERAARSSELVTQQVSLGVGQPEDAAVARFALGRLKNARTQASIAHESARGELQLLLDADPSERFVTRGSLALPSPQPAGSKPLRHPDATFLAARGAQQQRTAELELFEAKPQLGVGARVTREGTGDWVLLAQVSLPLPVFDSHRYSARVGTREVRALELEAAHTTERLGRLSDQLERRLRQQRELVARIEVDQVAPARQALQLVQYQFEAAKLPLQSLLLAQERVADAESNQLDARFELERYRLQLAWADGSLLDWARSLR